MTMALLGGAPGVGKTATARECLGLSAGGSALVQWIDVDALWAHQPWRVNDTMIAMLQSNLRAVIEHAADADVDLLLVTWVFQDTSFHDLLESLAPAEVRTTTVQLRAGEPTWRARFTADTARPEINAFYTDRYRAAQATPVDHVIETDGLDVRSVAQATMTALGL